MPSASRVGSPGWSPWAYWQVAYRWAVADDIAYVAVPASRSSTGTGWRREVDFLLPASYFQATVRGPRCTMRRYGSYFGLLG